MFRLLKIYKVAAKYRLDEFIDGIGKGRLLSFLLRINFPARLGNAKLAALPRAQRLRLALEELGPIFIKFGQLLSTRRDFVPLDIADELARLQDKVPPFDPEQARDLIESALEGKIEDLFTHFQLQPLASASIAQVHSAELPGNEQVVVKVIRPGIEGVIAQDITLLHRLAAFIERYVKDGKRLHAREVVRDYEHVIFDELNLMMEAANTAQLKRNFAASEILYVPKVYWDYCRSNVLVMERIHGIPVNDVESLNAAGVDMKKLAETGVEIFFTQVFNHSFFHADMHPGNIFVSAKNPQRPRYIAIDCAIIGSLSHSDQQYLAKNLLAIFKRDYRRVAELHVECGWVPPDTPVNAFEAAMRSVCEPIFEKPLKDISFGMLLVQLFQTAGRFNMEVQPSLVLLQKTLLNIEGLGRQLYPDLDLWQSALPFLEEWQRKRLSPFSVMARIRDKFPEWLEQLPDLPELVYEAMDAGRRRNALHEQGLAAYEQKRAEENRQRSAKTLKIGFTALVAAALLSHPLPAQWLGDLPLASLLLGLGGLGLLFFRL